MKMLTQILVVGDSPVDTKNDIGTDDDHQLWRWLFIYHFEYLIDSVFGDSHCGAAIQIYASQSDGGHLYFYIDRSARICEWNEFRKGREWSKGNYFGIVFIVDHGDSDLYGYLWSMANVEAFQSKKGI